VIGRALLLTLLAAAPAWAQPPIPRRVVSLNLCTDQFLLLLAPEKAVAVTMLAADPALSFVANEARRVPAVRADAEAVLALQPDLVLAAPWGAQATLAALERRGVRVERIRPPSDFTAVAAETRRLAALLDESARGAALLAGMETQLTPTAEPHRSALLLEARGYSAGPETLGGAVLRAAGFRNAGGRRLGLEDIVAHPPDLLVVTQAPAMPSMATDLLLHPVLAPLPRAVLPPALLVCGGPWSARAVALLRP
jgi:iron complex transport system substrate-binding protein